MELEQEPQTTLRDDINAALDEVVGGDGLAGDGGNAAGGAIEPELKTAAASGVEDSAIIGETAEQRADRIRDEKGRFAKGEKPAADKPLDATAPAAPVATDPTAPTAAKPQRPSTWKKDHWAAFDKLAAENPQLAEYINQRESEYARGVSTYKAEADRAREVQQAIEPFAGELQQVGVSAAQWIQNATMVQRALWRGSPQQKIQVLSQLARDAQIPLQALSPQPQVGPDGQQIPQAPVEQFMQFVNPLHDELRQVRGEVNAWKSQQEQQKQAEIQSQIQRFASEHPEFEQVRETMAGLLQSGLAQDLDSALKAAVRMPQHDDIFQAQQQQQREETERKAAEERRANTARARNQTVSTRSGVPTAPKSTGNGKSGLRDTIAEQVEAVMGGRV